MGDEKRVQIGCLSSGALRSLQSSTLMLTEKDW